MPYALHDAVIQSRGGVHAYACHAVNASDCFADSPLLTKDYFIGRPTLGRLIKRS